MILIYFLISLSSINNLPMAGAVMNDSAKVLIGLDGDDSTRVIYSLDSGYGTTSDTVYGTHNKMTLTGLQKDTSYNYKVIVWDAVDVETTAARSFRTPDTSGTFTFLHFQDLFDNPNDHYTIEHTAESLLNVIKASHHDADFIMWGGDMFDLDNAEEYYRADSCYWAIHNYFDTCITTMSIIPVMGNHEMFGTTSAQIDSSFAVHNRQMIYYPTGTKPGSYYFTWGGSIFVVYNDITGFVTGAMFSSYALSHLTNTINNIVRKGNYNWKLGFHHMNYANMGVTFQDQLFPLLNRGRIHVDFSGHAHGYFDEGLRERTKWIRSGGGSTKTPHFQRINVYSSDSIRGYVIDTGGDTIDTWSRVKNPQGTAAVCSAGVSNICTSVAEKCLYVNQGGVGATGTSQITGDWTVFVSFLKMTNTAVSGLCCWSDKTNMYIKLETGATANNAGAAKFGWVKADASTGTVSITDSLYRYEWHCIAVSFDSSEQKFNYSTYRYGNLQSSGQTSATTLSNKFTGHYVGYRSSLTYEYLVGYLGAYHVYTAVLDTSELKGLSKNPRTPLSSNLYLCWKFNEGSGSTIIDYSGNQTDGTVSGTYQWVVGSPNEVGRIVIDDD